LLVFPYFIIRSTCVCEQNLKIDDKTKKPAGRQVYSGVTHKLFSVIHKVIHIFNRFLHNALPLLQEKTQQKNTCHAGQPQKCGNRKRCGIDAHRRAKAFAQKEPKRQKYRICTASAEVLPAQEAQARTDKQKLHRT